MCRGAPPGAGDRLCLLHLSSECRLVVPAAAVLHYPGLSVPVLLFLHVYSFPPCQPHSPVQTERQLNWHELIKTPSNNGPLTGPLSKSMSAVTDRRGGLVDRLRLRRERGGGLGTGRAFPPHPVEAVHQASWDKESQAYSVSN